MLTDYIKKYLKRATLGVAGLALASGAFAQKAELGLTLTKKDGKPAAGIVNIIGSDTTINDKAFLSPKNYVLRNVTGIDDTIIDDKIRAGPNPTYNGNLNIYIQSSNQLEGVITAFDILGKKLGQVDLSQDNYLNFNSKSNLIILEYINKQERQTLKIVNMGNQFNANIIQENIAWEQNQKDKLESSKGALSDDYSVSFTDPTINIENYSKNITVSPGNKVNINEVLDWTAKEIKYSSNTNTNTTIKVIRVSDGATIDERTVANGIFPVKSLSQRFDNDAGKGIQIKYELTAPYTDPATFTATQFKNQEYKLDTIRNGQFSLTVTGNGTTYTVKSAGATIATKNVGEQTAFKKQGDVVSLELIVSRTGYITETRGVNMNKGLLTQDVQLIPQSAQTYNHVVHGTALSNLSGKTIRNGTSMYLVKAVGDTIWTTTNSGAFSFSWTDLAQNVSVKTGSRNVPGHNQNEITRSIDNDENLSITFTGLTYSLTQPIHVQNQYNEDISSASITGGDATVITNSTGRATLTRSNLQTDANNIPLANYTLSLAITKSNIQTLNTTTVSIAGANSEVLKNVMQEYIYWLRGTNTTPNGATIAGVRDGTTIYTATVSGTTYETNHVTGTTKTQTLNTLTFSAPNYTTQTRTNITLNEGANTIDAQLTPSSTNYPHLANGSALSSISGKTIRDGTRIYLTPAPGDTTWTTTSGGSFSFNWTSSVQNQTVKIGSRNVPGHNPREISIAVDDNTNTPITFTGLTYSFTHQVHVQNQYNENVSSASIAGGDATVNTNSSGTATVTRSNLQTDANNLPLANYTTNLTITKSNIQTLNTSITSTTGTNAEALRNVIQEYIYWLRGTNTTPSGASVTGVRDGTTIYTATVNGTTYETNHVTGTTKTQTLNTLTFSAPNYTTQTRTNITLNEGANTIDAQLTPSSTNYPHLANGSALSSIAGKTIRDGTRIYLTPAPGDTTWTTTSGGSFSFNWNSSVQNQTVKIGSRNVPGHNPREISIAVDDNTNTPITFTGLTYSFTHQVHVQNQYNENVSSASIAGGDATVNTNSSGIATVTRSNLQTDANNLPLANYTTNLTITKSNIQTLNTSITSTTGTNAEALRNVIQEYIYWLRGTNTTPSGASVTGVRDGTTIYTATVNGTTYETNHVTGTTKTQTLNTLTFSAPNYTTQTRTNITLNEGANTIDAQLTPETTSYPHQINGSALSSIAGKTIRDGTRIYAVKAVGDTLWTTTSGGSFSFSWTDQSASTSTKVGSRSVPGHNTNEVTRNIDNSESVSVTFTGLTYSLSKPVRVQNQYNENVSSASITGGDNTETTGTDGRATITRSNLQTDANNLPLSSYTLSLTITKDNIQTKNQNVTATTGTNSESLINVIQEYIYWLYGNNTTPSGATVTGVKDGETLYTATVNGTSFETNHVTGTTKTQTLNTVTFSAPNYTTQTRTNITLNEGANNIEAQLEAEASAQHSFRIRPRTINGDAISSLTLDLTWADGTTTHHSVSGDGYIYVNRTESGEPTTKVKVSHSSSSYNYMQIFRTPDHELADTNYCQTQRFDGNPMYAELNLTDIPYDLVEYLLPRQIKVPTALEGTYGSYINIDAAVIRDMMGGRFSNQTTKFIPRPGAESVYVFQMTFNEDSGVQIEQSQLDRVKTELDKVLSIYTLNDGTHLLPYEFYTISSTSDPKWVEAQARDTFDNVARTTFWNSNAYNGTTLTTTYSINGHARLKNSFSKYNIGTGSPVIFTEIYQQFTNNKDPPEESGAWVTTTTGSVTDFGNAMAKIIYLFNQGTPTD